MVEKILLEVSRHFGVRLKDLMGTGRHSHVSRPRMVAMWLVRDLTKMSYPSIGFALGGRDHTTIIYGVSKIERLILEGNGSDPLVLGALALKKKLQEEKT